MLAFAAILTAILLAPYLFSRLNASSNRIQSFTDQTGVTKSDARGSFDGNIRILAYNIAHGRGSTDTNWDKSGSSKPARITEIAELIRAADVDVVVLNEVDFDSTWSGRQNQAAAIAEQAGFPYRAEERNFDFAFAHLSWRFGNAILSKHPIKNATLVDLPDYAGWESWLAGCKRGVVCEITPTDAEPIQVMGVHLSHRSETLRTRSARMILDFAGKSSVPLIVAGDFNSTPAGFPGTIQTPSNALDTLLASKLFQTRPNEFPIANELTFSSIQPESVIDWILVPREYSIDSYHTIESVLSDHRPVVCEVSVNPTTP